MTLLIVWVEMSVEKIIKETTIQPTLVDLMNEEIKVVTKELDEKIIQQEHVLNELKRERDIKMVMIQVEPVVEFIHQLKPVGVSFGEVSYINKALNVAGRKLMFTGWTFSITIACKGAQEPATADEFPLYRLIFKTPHIANYAKRCIEAKLEVYHQLSIYTV